MIYLAWKCARYWNCRFDDDIRRRQSGMACGLPYTLKHSPAAHGYQKAYTSQISPLFHVIFLVYYTFSFRMHSLGDKIWFLLTQLLLSVGLRKCAVARSFIHLFNGFDTRLRLRTPSEFMTFEQWSHHRKQPFALAEVKMTEWPEKMGAKMVACAFVRLLNAVNIWNGGNGAKNAENVAELCKKNAKICKTEQNVLQNTKNVCKNDAKICKTEQTVLQNDEKSQSKKCHLVIYGEWRTMGPSISEMIAKPCQTARSGPYKRWR